jgi:hypothetical protein
MSLPLSEPVEHIAEFIVYAMPGFLALHIYRSVYPVKGLSEFLQVAWSVIYGVALAAVVRALDANYFNNILHSSDEGFPRIGFILVLAGFGMFWGLLLAGFNWTRLFLSGRSQFLQFIAPDVQSIWAKINRSQSTDWAVVFAEDGVIYMGWIKEFTYDPDADDNDFLLSQAKRLNADGSIQYEIDGQGVYLNTRNVKHIEFVKGE